MFLISITMAVFCLSVVLSHDGEPSFTMQEPETEAAKLQIQPPFFLSLLFTHVLFLI